MKAITNSFDRCILPAGPRGCRGPPGTTGPTGPANASCEIHNSDNSSFVSVCDGEITGVADNYFALGTTEDMVNFSGTLYYDVNNHSLRGGTGCTASGLSSLAYGTNCTSSGDNSQAFGFQSNATAYASHAEGISTNASATGSHSEGIGGTASGYASHSEGRICRATGTGAHAEGSLTQATGSYSHSEGFGAISTGDATHAEGITTFATGPASHAEGIETNAIALFSHAEGNNTTTFGESSHSEGVFTIASGIGSHSEGINSIALGNASHCGGSGCSSSGVASFVHGLRISTLSDNNVAFGVTGTIGSGFPNCFLLNCIPGAELSIAGGTAQGQQIYMAADNMGGVTGSANNAYVFYTNAAHTSGVFLRGGSTNWEAVSQKNVKTIINSNIDHQNNIELLDQCSVDKWMMSGIINMGLYAEDVYEKFGLNDGNRIGTQDSLGIALSCIKGMYAKHKKLEEEFLLLKAELEELKGSK